MGYIYKITNNINDLIYIGQTKNSLEKRLANHRTDCYREDKYKGSKLYNAMRKYGVDNFEIVLIEEVENDMLDEREKYWIHFYNSKNQGYNMTYSGQGIVERKPYLLNNEVEKNSLKKDYYNNMSTQELSEKYKVSKATIWRRLKQLGIEPNVGFKQKFVMFDNNIEYEFYDTATCAKWIQTLNLTTAPRKTIINSIRRVLQNERNSYLGFRFKYKGETE